MVIFSHIILNSIWCKTFENFELKDKEESLFKNKKELKREKFCYKLYLLQTHTTVWQNISKVLSSFLE